MLGQIELLDYLSCIGTKEPINPELHKGDTIYKLILDVIETGIIDHIWECNDGHGYSAKQQSGYLTFWTDDIGDTVFTNKTQAEAKANSLRETFKVIRKHKMHVIRERSFIRPTFDNRVMLTATVKLLEGNMVYYERWMCYPFLEILKTENEAEKFYSNTLKKIMEEVDGIKAFETNIHVELQDMYLSQTKLWSNYRYTEFNGPVLTLPHHS
jgi:hypothetical protein